jgi:hypothetical protein
MLREGQCLPYTDTANDRINPCDRFYRPGIDYVYLPFGRARNDLATLNDFAADSSLVISVLRPECRYIHDTQAGFPDVDLSRVYTRVLTRFDLNPDSNGFGQPGLEPRLIAFTRKLIRVPIRVRIACKHGFREP